VKRQKIHPKDGQLKVVNIPAKPNPLMNQKYILLVTELITKAFNFLLTKDALKI
jgi:hypothetical protein